MCTTKSLSMCRPMHLGYSQTDPVCHILAVAITATPFPAGWLWTACAGSPTGSTHAFLNLIPLHGLPQWQYNITCSNESASFIVTTPDTVLNITNLLSNATYNCRVVAIWKNKASSRSHPPVSFTPGKLSSRVLWPTVYAHWNGYR